MKKYIMIFVFGAGLAFNSNAEIVTGEKCGDNCTWTFNTDTKELIISGTGEMSSFGAIDPENNGGWRTNAPWGTYADQISKIRVQEGITSLGSYAFYNATAQSVELPSTLTSLGVTCTFQGARQLKDINIPQGVTIIPNSIFSATNNLTSIILPDSVTTLASSAFSKDSLCTNPIEIVISDHLTSVDEQAFRNIQNLTIYCTGDIDVCKTNVGENFADKVKQASKKEINGVTYVYDSKGKLVTTSGSRTEKRIYTIDEANQVAGKVNRFRIKYR